MKKALTLFALIFATLTVSGQVIPSTLMGISYIGTTNVTSHINPNTGAVTTLVAMPTNTLYQNGFDAAYNCDKQQYVYGSDGNQVIVTDGNTGNFINPFGYPVFAVCYNQNTKLYYGIDGQRFVSFDPVFGIYNTLSTFTINSSSLIYFNNGSTIDLLNDTYITTMQTGMTQKFVSFSCINGSYTISPSITVNGDIANVSWPIRDNSKNKLFGMGLHLNPPVQLYFCEMSVSSGVITPIATYTSGFNFMSGGSVTKGGCTVDEVNNVYTYIRGGGSIVNISTITGSLISMPALSLQDTYIIQYMKSECSEVSNGLHEESFAPGAGTSTYFDIYGRQDTPEPGKLLIEQRGTVRRKVVIQAP